MFLVVTRNFPPDIGGIQNLMEGLSNALISHGPVKVLADAFDNAEVYDNKSRLDIKRVAGLKLFRKYRKANLINEFLKENDVRAVFFDHWKSIENVNHQYLKKTKSFCLMHSKEINHIIGSSLNKRMIKSFNKANYIIANSKFTKELALKNGIFEKKIKIINPGCNYPIKIEDLKLKEAQTFFKNSFPKIITVARLDKRKSHQNILMTIKNLKPKFPKIKYISIGDGEERKNLIKLRQELNLENEVVFIQHSDEQLKAALLSISDLYLMPSIIYKKSVEGFGISFIESASYGVGSIGGTAGGEADAILNGKTGYLCDGDDLSSVYDTISKFFEKNNYVELGKNAFEFSKKFKWSAIIKKYLELI